MTPPDCYSIRRLSPFQGILEVIKTVNARALSVDGLNWHVQVRCDRRRPKWGSLDNDKVSRQYVAFGIWSRKEGLGKLPIDPTLEIMPIERSAQAVIEALNATADSVPLPRKDPVELWLLDAKEKMPLALLASVMDGRAFPRFRRLEWLPTPRNEMRFIASSLTDTKTHRKPRPVDHGDRLTELVRRTAGRQPCAQWFRRDGRGDGIGLDEVQLDSPWRGRQLPREAFPELPLREDWENPVDRRLVADFHEWQAPFLLTLAEITPSTRDRLERAAGQQAMLVHALHRLYPEIVNRDVLNAALVEAVIRKTATN